MYDLTQSKKSQVKGRVGKVKEPLPYEGAGIIADRKRKNVPAIKRQRNL